MAVPLLLAGCGNPGGEAAQDSGNGEEKVSVVLRQAEQRHFEDRLVVHGTLEAKNTSLVSPRIDGTLDAIYVEEGDPVKAGETKLFQIDRVRVAQAVTIAEQDLAMARGQRQEAEANLERLQAQYDKAEKDYHRFTRLLEKEAVTQDAFEKVEAQYKQAKAGLKHARTVVGVAEEQVRKAEAALRISRKNLSDSLVYAPIGGVVSHRMKEPGEMGSAGRPVVRIEDPTLLEVSVFVPEQYYPRVSVGKTMAHLAVGDEDAGADRVSYKRPTIQPELRTFEVKCLIEDPPDYVVPGALAETAIVFTERDALGVPSEAIQVRHNKQVVFTIREATAHRVPIETGLETGGWTEVTGGAVEAGMAIAAMGLFLLEEGTAVTVLEESD